MRSLQSALSAPEKDLIRVSVGLRFKNPSSFKTPEALVIYEQKMLEEEKLKAIVEEEYGFELETPRPAYLPSEVVEHFMGKDCVPISYDRTDNKIHVGVLPETKDAYIQPYMNSEVVRHLVPIYYYVEHYTRLYNEPNFLLEVPEYDIFNFIVDEAIKLGAADITLSSRASEAVVYYNVRKRKVYSKRLINKAHIGKIGKLLEGKAGAMASTKNRKPGYFSVDLTPHYRGRVIIAPTFHGKSITIRVLPNDIFESGLEKLNLTPSTIEFIREKFTSEEYGLRLLIGPTFSGKNTTMMSALYEKVSKVDCKAVSVEMPVELLVNFMEQIDCQTEEEYVEATTSLLRQNPDLVYITEMIDSTAVPTMKASNTGKSVYTSLHANSVADSISRVQDMTGLSLDRIILGMQSAIYQELVIDGDSVKPVNRCVHFSTEFKDSLLGKSLGEVTKAIREVESRWV